MSSNHKPDGYNSVSPYLIVDGADRTIEFLKTALDASGVGRTRYLVPK